MSLPDLHGYWKYGDAVVPFRLPLAPVKVVTQGYIPRKLPTTEINVTPLSQNFSNDQQKPAHDTKEHQHVIAENETKLISSVVNRSEAAHEAAQYAAEVLAEALESEFDD